MTPEEAALRAQRDFGGMGREKERARDAWGIGLAQDLTSDVRQGVRSLHRSPAFTVVVVLTLALGCGAATAMFSAVDAVLLRPLPFRDPDRLMKLSLLMPRRAMGNPDGPAVEMIWSYPKYRLVREAQRDFDDLTTYFRGQYNLTQVDEPERLWGEVVQANYLSVLGIRVERGRGFDSQEDSTAASAYEAILTLGCGSGPSGPTRGSSAGRLASTERNTSWSAWRRRASAG